MSNLKLQFYVTVESYAERAQLARDLQHECARFERGEKVDLSQTGAKLGGLVRLLKQDRIAMMQTKSTQEFRNAYRAHKKDIIGLTARVNALSAKANCFPAWVKPVGFAALAIVGLAATTCIATQLGIFSSTPTPIQTVFSLHPEEITVFTSYTTENSERVDMSRAVSANQRKYCDQHGYKYEVYEKNLAHVSESDTSLPYWSKIAGINHILNSKREQGNPSPSWIVWMDDDEVVLDRNINMEEFIRDHGGSDPGTHVIVTSDVPHAGTIVNTGILIVRNSNESRDFFKELWNMRHEVIYAGKGMTTYSTCPSQSCFHEQQAMHDLLRYNPGRFGKIVRVIPQTDEHGVGINTFKRFEHFDYSRSDPWNGRFPMKLEFNDPSGSTCKSQDFICQCTGLAANGKRNELDPSPTNLRKECIDELLKTSNLT